MVKFLIANRVDVQRVAMMHRNPLFFAKSGQVATLLIDAGCAVNRRDDNGNTPLHIACERGFLDVVEVFTKNNAQLNAIEGQKQTPLHRAAENGHADVVELLLKIGAPVKAMDMFRQTPEMLARSAKHYKVLEVIAEYHENNDDLNEVPSFND
jgi:ankyrin repeat protein